jgi:pimeloyl-ACP methyl ester carboxylesterase
MGFLPALDGLTVVHDLMRTFALNKTRLFLLGTSYGGYIAGLIAKFAPRTFRMIVDNSGFSSASDDRPAVLGWQKLFMNGVAMLCQNVPSWSPDPGSPHFFSEERQTIRNLLCRAHVFPGTARIYAYHSATDTVAPTERKQRLRDTYKDRVAYELAIIDENQIDGRNFKTLAHGMNASLRGLFDLSHEKFLRDGGALSDATDFDHAGDYVFACGAQDYRIAFSPEQGVRAVLRAA